MTIDEILKPLNTKQREVMNNLLGPVCVLAGAGTGKTTAMTHRIAYGVKTATYDPKTIMALSFTTKAAAVLGQRLYNLGVKDVSRGTFHSMSYRQLRYFWNKISKTEAPIIVGSREKFILEYLKNQKNILNEQKISFTLANEIGWSKVSLINPKNYAFEADKRNRGNELGYPPERIQEMIEEVENYKVSKNLVDFDDCLILLSCALQENQSILNEITSKYKHFIVDEYQDVSPLQQYMLDIWLDGRENLCVVGDPAQTIYSFSGATDFFINNFSSVYKNAKIISLNQNYRSNPAIINLANKLLEKGGTKNWVKLIPVKAGQTQVSFNIFENDVAEIEAIVKSIKYSIKRGAKFGDNAVLFRRNSDSLIVKKLFEKYAIPYQMKVRSENATTFFETAQIKTFLEKLKKIALEENLSGVQDPIFKNEKTLTEKLKRILSLVSKNFNSKNPDTKMVNNAYFDALLGIIEKYDDTKTLFDFYQYINGLSRNGNEPYINLVTISTLHSSKGMEWPHVFIIGAYQGSIPVKTIDKTNKDEVEEERRLLFVGITRAMNNLNISFSRKKTSDNRLSRRKSQFLDNIL